MAVVNRREIRRVDSGCDDVHRCGERVAKHAFERLSIRVRDGKHEIESSERRAYAREVLGRFAAKAFRRPADEKTIERLVSIAEEAYNAPDKSFEQGVAQAMVAVLASPR